MAKTTECVNIIYLLTNTVHMCSIPYDRRAVERPSETAMDSENSRMVGDLLHDAIDGDDKATSCNHAVDSFCAGEYITMSKKERTASGALG